MNILLLDDHVSFCQGLKAALLSVRSDYQVTFETRPEGRALAALLARGEHDLLLLDLMMPGLNGIEVLRQLHAAGCQTPVLILSSVEDPAVVRQAFQLGVLGYLPKSYSVYQIIEAIEECRLGNLHLPPFLDAGAESTAGGETLTPRQLEVLQLMEQGLSNQAIADALCISKATVKTHLNHLFRHFNVSNRVSCLRAVRTRSQQGLG